MSALGATEQLCLGCMRPKGDGEICPRCGYRLDPNRNPLALPCREVVGQKFLIGRILGKPGGFGMTYLAWDLVLQTAVAVKEYLPRDLASRPPTAAPPSCRARVTASFTNAALISSCRKRARWPR
jgi:serine/threonine protein kinase